jgi:hypothetical protein
MLIIAVIEKIVGVLETSMNSWTVVVERDENGELIIDIGEACKQLGWNVGDTIQWVDNKDGTWLLQRKESE